MGLMVVVDAIEFLGTVAVASGVTVGPDGGLTDDRVKFGMDHRPAMGLCEVLEEEGEVLCEVEGWQIMYGEKKEVKF